MTYPKLMVDLKKIENNVSAVATICEKNGVSIAGVTKVFCGDPQIAQAYIQGGVSYLADSRIENIKKLKDLDIEKMMLRIPMLSEVEDIVDYVDISFNSEIETIRAIGKIAEEKGKVHRIVLMFDLGDLREGYFDEEDLYDAVGEILKEKGIKLIGVGTNMACYGGVIPEESSLLRLVSIGKEIEDRYKLKLELISGGNSATLHLAQKGLTSGINNLRLGESLVLGTEPSFETQIPGTVNDAFKLQVQIIEIKDKPSVPQGRIGKDAFGNIPTFVDRGVRKRMICGIGKQDIDLDTMFPIDEDIIILGGSSDHLILDGTDSKTDYQVGDIVEFRLSYVSMLRAMTSEYVSKKLV